MPSVQTRRRLAWLLRVNRILGNIPQFISARRFADAFRQDGQPALSPSQVTRWETGQVMASSAIISRYEVLLGLPSDSLLIVSEAYATFVDGPLTRSASTKRTDDQALHALLDRASTSGAMTGHDWRELAVLVNSRPDLVLHPPRLWRSITETLLNELVCAEHEAWHVRQGAMSRLLAHSTSSPYAVDACVDMVEDRDNPVFIEPISLLDAAHCDRASRFVVTEVIEPRNEPSLHGALLAAASKLRRGHFAMWERRELDQAVGRLARDYERHMVLKPLIDDLADALHRGHKLNRTAATIGWAHRIAVSTQTQLSAADGRTDDVLADLVGEALFAINADSRLYAAALLGTSPYRDALVIALTDTLGKVVIVRDDLLVERVLRLLTRLRATGHQRWADQLLLNRAASPQARHAAAWAASHSVGRRDDAVWRAILRHQIMTFAARPSPLDQDILRGLVYSIGAESHGRLLDLIVSHPAIPASMRQLAAWWRRHTTVAT
jgi:hypothetical protein